jgi:cytochrome P450
MSPTRALPGEPGFRFEPYDPSFERDPYPTWALLRKHAPVYWWPESEAWVLTRHADVMQVMREEDRFSTDRRVWEKHVDPPPEMANHPVVRLMLSNLFAYEGADHTRLRRLASAALTRRAVRELVPLMETLIDDLISPLLHRGKVEMVSELASVYPVTVISRLLGIPEKSDREREFKRYADGLVAAANPTVGDEIQLRAFQLATELVGEIETLMAEKRRAPADDLMTAMLQAETEGDRFDEQEIVGMIMTILVAGAETTANSMAFGILELLRNPEQLTRFREDPSIRSNAAYEIIRYQMPGRFVNRYAKIDTEFNGHTIHRGQLLLCSIPSAQRDPAAISDPDRFDISREHSDQSALGIGRHFCLGAQLARLELEISLGRIVERLPNLRFDCDPAAIEFRSNPTVRGPAKLELRFDPVG